MDMFCPILTAIRLYTKTGIVYIIMVQWREVALQYKYCFFFFLLLGNKMEEGTLIHQAGIS